MRVASSSCVMPKSSSSCWYAEASSSGFSSDAVQVLEQRVAQQVLVGGVADDRRDRVEAGLPGGARAALAHDELVRALVAGGADDDGLQDAELADAVDELGEVVGVEVGARLTRVGDDRVRIDVDESRAGNRDESSLGGLVVCAVGGAPCAVGGARAGRRRRRVERRSPRSSG